MYSLNYTYTSTGGEQIISSPQETSIQKSIDNPVSINEQLMSLDDEKMLIEYRRGLLIEKGLKSNDPKEILQANKAWNDVSEKQDSGIKSQIIDPYELSHSLGYKYKTSSLSYGLLRTMVRKTPIIGSIISTRQTQVSAFATPQQSKYSTGFIIQKKKPFYSTESVKLTKEDEKKIQVYTQFILDCGSQGSKWHGDTFDKFLRGIVDDSLTLDQACFEVARNKFGRPTEFLSVDGGTIRLAESIDDNQYQRLANNEKFGYGISHVQVIDGQVYNEYFPWEMCMGMRNTCTDIRSNGYGRSELEDLVNIITWMLFGDDYNGRFFSQGSAPKGLLKVSKGVNRAKVAEFRQQWLNMVAGVQNAWKVPIIESDSMEWIDLQKNNTDMQFAKWQEYLVKVSCAVFKMAPEEIGFNLGNAGGGNPLFEKDSTARVEFSRDKGLVPLLSSIEGWINRWIMNALDSEFEFKFVGIEVEDEDKQLERDIKAVSNFEGLKEVRRRRGLPDQIDEDDIILNNIYFQNKNQQQMMNQQMESNQVVDDQDGGQDDGGNYSFDGEDEWMLKSQNSNILLTELNDWFQKEILE